MLGRKAGSQILALREGSFCHKRGRVVQGPCESSSMRAVVAAAAAANLSDGDRPIARSRRAAGSHLERSAPATARTALP